MVAPTSESPPTTLAFDPPTSNFQPDVSSQRPRAWERLPKSPFTRRRKGKKVWKRYEALGKTAVSEMGNCLSLDSEAQAQNTEPDSFTHNAKRLRSRNVSIGGDDGVEQKPSKYVTTLRDQVAGTPRRKAVRRRSLRPDRLRSVTMPVDSHDERTPETPEQDPSIPQVLVKDDVTHRTTHLEEEEEEEGAEVEADPVQPKEGPLSEDIDEALSSPLSSEHVEEDHSSPRQSPDISSPEIPNAVELRIEAFEDCPTQDGHLEESTGISLAAGFLSPMLAEPLLNRETAAHTVLSESFKGGNYEATSDGTQVIDDKGSGHQIDEERSVEIRSSKEEHIELEEDKKNVLSWASTSPRRSLRRSSRSSSVTKGRLSMHCTAVSTEPPPMVVETSEIEGYVERIASSPSSVADERASESPSQDRYVRKASRRLSDRNEHDSAGAYEGICATSLMNPDPDDADTSLTSNIGQEDIDTTEYCPCYAPTSVEDQAAIQNNEHPSTDEGELGEEASDQATIEQLSEHAINEKNLNTHVADRQVEILDSHCHETQGPQMKTRSGARFSDDTKMLKDFLSRAQARKLVKEVTLAPGLDANTGAAAISPRRSQRNALATLDSNSPSRHMPRELANDPGTPPSKPRRKEVHREGKGECTAQGSPVRRSTRKRLLAPANPGTGAPSFIPVRRADGTDPVVLQKSVAQELALVTQTNTRRNKGQSRPPAVILKSLPVEIVEEGTKGGHDLRNCKSVGWDRKLVYYQDGVEAIVDLESKTAEKRPKARRLQGLGAGNGTPAPKRKTADVLSSNGTPASKRHSRVR
ncbi:MAG: hypothetical protein Q9172_003594 [Xanthocarpia lactea]